MPTRRQRPISQVGLPLYGMNDQDETYVINDFEASVFILHPEIEMLKQSIYHSGAVYASMSGSGSSLFGIFRKPPALTDEIGKHVIWKGPMRIQSEVGL